MNRSPLNLFPKRFSSPVLWTKVSLFNRARTATVRTSGIAGSCLRSIFNDRARWGGSQLFLDELYQNSFVKHEKRVDNFITTQSLKLCQEQRRNALVAKDGTVFCNGLRGMKLLPQTQTIMRCYYNVVFMSTAVKSRDGRMCNGETAAAENKDEFASRKDNRDYRLPAEIPDFSNSHLAHGDKSMMELVRGILVLNTCRIGFIVNNSKALLKWSYRLFGSTITDTVLKHTFFKHFCAGETSQSMRPQIERMRSVGNVYSILDYAAESDDRGSSNQDADSSAQSSSKNQARESAPKDSSENANEDLNNAGGHNEKLLPVHNLNQPARVYTYQSEQGCDEHRDNFLSCIDAVSDVSPERGFAAIKVSALGNPVLLERMSSAIVEARKLYERFDGNNDGIVTRDEFSEGYRSIFVDAETKLPEILDLLDPNNKGSIDFISWSKLITPLDIPRLTKSCKTVGPLARAAPSEEELELLHVMHDRAHVLAQAAADSGTRLLFDAEQTYYQPAIDNLVLELQQKYNATNATNNPVIFNTYQCYLKDMPQRMILDLERSQRFSYHFGAKLVRGAYMEAERALAHRLNCPSPIHETIEDTHKCYNNAIEHILRYHAEHNENKLEVMCGTHNRQSIEKIINLMKELNIKANDSTVHFGQLLGMSDNLTFPLGRNGFQAYKYVPYGKVDEAVAYLMRRALENRSMLQKSNSELSLLYDEVRNRLIG